MMSQLNATVALPTYNSLLAGWGLFCAYGRSGSAVFGLLGFLGVSFLLDIIFLSLWSSGDADILSRDDESTGSATTSFSVAMMSLNCIVKCAVVYYGAHLYAVLSPASLAQRPSVSALAQAQQGSRSSDSSASSPVVRRSASGSDPRGGSYALPSSPPPRPPSMTPARPDDDDAASFSSSARRGSPGSSSSSSSSAGPGSPAAGRVEAKGEEEQQRRRQAVPIPALNLKQLPGGAGGEGKDRSLAEAKSDGGLPGADRTDTL